MHDSHDGHGRMSSQRSSPRKKSRLHSNNANTLVKDCRARKAGEPYRERGLRWQPLRRAKCHKSRSQLTCPVFGAANRRAELVPLVEFVRFGERERVGCCQGGEAMAMTTMAIAMAKTLIVASPSASPSVSCAALRPATLPPSSLLGNALPLSHGGGGSRDRWKNGRTGLIQASSSQTPVDLVQRRLIINLLALAGTSFSLLPVDLLSGRQIPRLAGLSQLLQARSSGNVANAASSTENGVLEFAKNDNRRLMHVVYRVGDLDKTIKFYTECLGMKLLRKRDITEEKYTNAFLGYGPEDSNFVVELTYNYGVDKYDIGTGFGHFGIAVEDVQKVVDLVKAKGGKVTREPGPVKGGKSIIAFVEDPDGYKFELIQRSVTPEPFCQVMFRVGDLDQAVQFYEKAFGMKELRRKDNPDQKYTIAMVGYGDDEMKTTVLELTYNYGVTEYTKGNGYGQIAVGTDDVYKTAEAVKTFGGKIVREPGPLPGLNTKITAVLDPDGWKSVFVDNVDFAKELE